MKRYKFFNSIFILLFFNFPAVLILWGDVPFEIFAFIQILGLMLLLGYHVPFHQRLTLTYNTKTLKHYLYAFWITILLIVFIKIMEIGFPGQMFFGRAYEEAFMSTYSMLTKIYLFAPIISAAVIILEKRMLRRFLLFAVSVIIIFIPGVKGSLFIFLFILIFYKLLETKKLIWTLIFFSFLVPLLTLSIFFVSHFVLRSTLTDVGFLEIVNFVVEKVRLYFEPNFNNLALTIDKSKIFQFGAVFTFPIVETLTLGMVRTTGQGQIWYFVDPSLKAGTFARDFWQDWGVVSPFFVFLLGVFYSWISSIVYGQDKINKILIAVLSFPFAFVFFYNEFSRNQIVFGFLLLILMVMNAKKTYL